MHRYSKLYLCFTSYCQDQNRFKLGKINLLQIKMSLESEKERQTKTKMPSSPRSFTQAQHLSFIPSSFTPSLHTSGTGSEEHRLWSVYDSSFLLLLPPQLDTRQSQAKISASPLEHTKRLHHDPARERSLCLAGKDLVSVSTPKTQNGCVRISFPSGFCGAVSSGSEKLVLPAGSRPLVSNQ